MSKQACEMLHSRANCWGQMAIVHGLKTPQKIGRKWHQT